MDRSNYGYVRRELSLLNKDIWKCTAIVCRVQICTQVKHGDGIKSIVMSRDHGMYWGLIYQLYGI